MMYRLCCLLVCPQAYLKNRMFEPQKNFVAVAYDRSFVIPGGVAIRNALPVSWMTSCVLKNGHAKVTRLTHQGQHRRRERFLFTTAFV